MTETLTITRQNPLWATGRRKTAIARVRVVPGEGRFFVNSKSLDEFFSKFEDTLPAEIRNEEQALLKRFAA